MKNRTYKVLFVDDQINSPLVAGFIDFAGIKGVNIKAVQLHKDAIEILKNDISNEYDAVILDVMGYYDKADGNEDKLGVRETLIEIRNIKKEQGKLIPWFIFSGMIKDDQEEEFLKEIKLTEKETAKFSREGKVYYTKAKDDDILLEDIVSAIEDNNNKEILYKFREPLQILKELNASQDVFDSFISILKSISSLEVNLNIESHLTNLRKIVELIFRGFVKIQVLPPTFIDKDQVNLAESSKFLSGDKAEHIGYRADKIYFNKGLANSLKNLIFFTSSGSHTSDDPILVHVDYKTYSKEIGDNSFILYQLSFIVLDLLLAYKNIKKENRFSEVNRGFWVKIDAITPANIDAQIEFDGEQYFSEKYVFNRNYVEINNHQNKRVKITSFQENTNNNTNNKYPLYVKTYSVIEK